MSMRKSSPTSAGKRFLIQHELEISQSEDKKLVEEGKKVVPIAVQIMESVKTPKKIARTPKRSPFSPVPSPHPWDIPAKVTKLSVVVSQSSSRLRRIVQKLDQQPVPVTTLKQPPSPAGRRTPSRSSRDADEMQKLSRIYGVSLDSIETQVTPSCRPTSSSGKRQVVLEPSSPLTLDLPPIDVSSPVDPEVLPRPFSPANISSLQPIKSPPALARAQSCRSGSRKQKLTGRASLDSDNSSLSFLRTSNGLLRDIERLREQERLSYAEVVFLPAQHPRVWDDHFAFGDQALAPLRQRPQQQQEEEEEADRQKGGELGANVKDGKIRPFTAGGGNRRK